MDHHIHDEYEIPSQCVFMCVSFGVPIYFKIIFIFHTELYVFTFICTDSGVCLRVFLLIRFVHNITVQVHVHSVCMNLCVCARAISSSRSVLRVHGLCLAPESRWVAGSLWRAASSLQHEIKFWPKGEKADHIHPLST